MAAVGHDREKHYFAEVDRGRLFIADGKYFQARSINCYNNFLTQFFAKLFGVAYEATLNGQTYVLNKKSYAKFIDANGFLPLDDSPVYRNINKLHLSERNSGTMRQAMNNPWKAKALAEKLFKAMAAERYSECEDLIGRGADLDSKAWYREDTKQYIFSQWIGDELSLRGHGPFRAALYSPLILAAMKAKLTGQWQIYNQLLAFDANPHLKGELCTFARHHVGTNHQAIPEVVMRAKVYERGHGPHVEKHVKYEPGLDLVTKQTHKFVDYYYDRAETSLWPDAQVAQAPLDPIAIPFEKTYTTGRLPIIA